jgi:hypothetical protein
MKGNTQKNKKKQKKIILVVYSRSKTSKLFKSVKCNLKDKIDLFVNKPVTKSTINSPPNAPLNSNEYIMSCHENDDCFEEFNQGFNSFGSMENDSNFDEFLLNQ